MAGARGAGMEMRADWHVHLLTPKWVCNAEVLLSSCRFGNLVVLRSQEDDLKNYSSTLQGFVHRHIPQGHNPMAF